MILGLFNLGLAQTQTTKKKNKLLNLINFNNLLKIT